MSFDAGFVSPRLDIGPAKRSPQSALLAARGRPSAARQRSWAMVCNSGAGW